MFAVIQTGGKQYIAEPGKIITIEKYDAPEGEEAVFDAVLLYDSGKGVPGKIKFKVFLAKYITNSREVS